MKSKRGTIGILLVVLVIAATALMLAGAYYLYLMEGPMRNYDGSTKSSNSMGTLSQNYIQSDSGSSSSGASAVAIDYSALNEENCRNLNDDYSRPDFKAAQILLSNQSFIKDVPKNGKISFNFYHFNGDCRIWDKIYFLNNGKIEEKLAEADIEIYMHSDYISKINETNICEVIKEARDKGDLGHVENVGATELVWGYGGMLKYKDCLSVELKSLSFMGIVKKNLSYFLDRIRGLL